MSKLRLTWKNVEEYVDQIARLYGGFALSGVYGIPRGGIVLAVMISHRLNIPLLMSPAPWCLIVDDICDSGESLLHYAKNSSSLDKPTYTISSMMYKRNDLVTPDSYWGVKTDEWVVFPWEKG